MEGSPHGVWVLCWENPDCALGREVSQQFDVFPNGWALENYMQVGYFESPHGETLPQHVLVISLFMYCC